MSSIPQNQWLSFTTIKARMGRLLSLVILLPLSCFAQYEFSVGVRSGALNSISQDLALSPYIFKGSSAFIGIELSYRNSQYVHEIRFVTCEPILTSAITFTMNNQKLNYIQSQFTSLRYSFFKSWETRSGFFLGGGASLGGRMFRRDFNTTGGFTQQSYGAIASADLVMYLAKKVFQKGTFDTHLYLPLYSFTAHPSYGLGPEKHTWIWAGGTFPSLEALVAYQYRVTKDIELSIGYSVLLSHYAVAEPHTTVIHGFNIGATVML